jgi:hypothetical protein
MIRSVFLLILTTTVFNINCTTRIGRIYNTSYVSNVTSIVMTYKNTCSECICNAFFSAVSPLYMGLNCYTNNKTCRLFANFSSLSLVKDLNATFIFIQLPPFQSIITGNWTAFVFRTLVYSIARGWETSAEFLQDWIVCEDRNIMIVDRNSWIYQLASLYRKHDSNNCLHTNLS